MRDVPLAARAGESGGSRSVKVAGGAGLASGLAILAGLTPNPLRRGDVSVMSVVSPPTKEFGAIPCALWPLPRASGLGGASLSPFFSNAVVRGLVADVLVLSGLGRGVDVRALEALA